MYFLEIIIQSSLTVEVAVLEVPFRRIQLLARCGALKVVSDPFQAAKGCGLKLDLAAYLSRYRLQLFGAAVKAHGYLVAVARLNAFKASIKALTYFRGKLAGDADTQLNNQDIQKL